MLLRIPPSEASVKVSKGVVNDDKEDWICLVWAGYLPYRTVVGPLKAVDELKRCCRNTGLPVLLTDIAGNNA